MPSVLSIDDKNPDGEDINEPPSQLNYTPLHSNAFSAMPMHMYPIPNQYLQPQQPVRSKRRQVKNACTHCQKACKKCDDARPCLRCVKYGISEECVDSQRKERKKGIKRGPYKKRDGKDRVVSTVGHDDMAAQGMPVSSGIPPTGGSPVPYMPMPGYPPGFYGQYPPLISKQGEGPPVYPAPQFFLAPHPMQPQLHGTPEGDGNTYPPQAYYQAAVLTPIPYHSQYAIPRTDGSTISPQYPIYPAHVYHKDASASGQNELSIGGTHVRPEAPAGVNEKGT